VGRQSSAPAFGQSANGHTTTSLDHSPTVSFSPQASPLDILHASGRQVDVDWSRPFDSGRTELVRCSGIVGPGIWPICQWSHYHFFRSLADRLFLPSGTIIDMLQADRSTWTGRGLSILGGLSWCVVPGWSPNGNIAGESTQAKGRDQSTSTCRPEACKMSSGDEQGFDVRYRDPPFGGLWGRMKPDGSGEYVVDDCA
jgi:hypothetical protein